jgi:hypothetical protein
MAYCGYIVKVKELRKHENADRLQIATFFGNDTVVSLDTNVGDMGIYFPTDGKLGEKYAEVNKLTRTQGGYLEDDKRHIKSIKLRGEKSDGLFMPITSLEKFVKVDTLKEGDTVTTLGGTLICEKYIPKGKQKQSEPTPKQGKKKKDKEAFPFFEQHIDTSQFAYNLGQFKEGDLVYITLKLHGTSQRTAHTVKKKQPNFLKRMLGIKSKKTWEYVSGTRRVTLNDFGGGFYGSNEFRKQHHDFFVGKLQKGEEVFYEVVGYSKDDQLIMPECDNKKTKDKEFIKQFGDKTRFTYGCGMGESQVYVYRMTMTNEDGHTVEYPTELVKLRCEQMGANFVPIFDKFIFTTQEDLLERVHKFENGEDPIGKTHIREGVIVRIENREKFTALKQKNFNFKVLEGIIKSEDVLDMEEADSEQVEQELV